MVKTVCGIDAGSLSSLTREELLALVASMGASIESLGGEMRSKDKRISDLERSVEERDAEIERQRARIYKLMEKLDRALGKVDAKNQTILRDNFNMIEGKSEHKAPIRQAAVNEAEADAEKAAKAKPRGRRKGARAETLTPEALEAMARPEDTVYLDPDVIGEGGWECFGEDVSYVSVNWG